MASSSGGSKEWSASIKALLAAPCGSFIRSDIPELVKTIISNEDEILTHDDLYESFYAPFTSLSAYYISSNTSSLTKNQLNSTCQACRILLLYFLNSLKKCDDQSCLLQKQIMSLIKSLCKGTGYLQRSDVITLTAMMKSAKLPSHIAQFTDSDKEDNVRSVTRAKINPGSIIVEQFMTPIHDSTSKSAKQDTIIEMVDKDSDTTVLHINDSSDTIKSLFAKRNSASLQQLNAGDLMVEECMTLPLLKCYVSRCDDAIIGKPLVLPTCLAGAACTSSTFKAVMNDLNVVKNTVSLPILEPLTDKRLKKLTKLTMSCIYAALSTTTAHCIMNIAGAGPVSKATGSVGSAAGGNTSVILAKDDDNDGYVAAIVEYALEIFNMVSSAIQCSTRAGGHNLQNLHLFGAVMLFSGIQHILNLNPTTIITEKTKDNVKKTPEHSGSTRVSKEASISKLNLAKLQGFGVLCVALTNHALTLITSLLDDLKVESVIVSADDGTDLTCNRPADLDILAHFTAWQRVLKLTTSVNLCSLLFNLASVSYRKACILKRIQKHPTDGDTFSASDSNTYYSDDFSCSEESSGDDDDDSELILGKWFEATLSVNQDSDSKASHAHPDGGNQSVVSSPSADIKSNRPFKCDSNIIPEKGEPHGFIHLATKLFSFINTHLVSSESSHINIYLRQCLCDQHLVTVAGIICDLDRETSRSEFGTISIYFGAVLGNLYNEFSQSLSCFTHNLLANNLLSEHLQKVLLTQLGVYPGSEGSRDEWPLQVFPRTLAILAQVLLIKQQKEKDDLISRSEVTIERIWTRLFHSLEKHINSTVLAHADDNEDINVEHLQLLLFLFNNIQLLRQKSILLSCAKTIINVASSVNRPLSDMAIIYLSRLLLIFEYMMKYLYDAPSVLIDQVHWNLFGSQLSSPYSSFAGNLDDKESDSAGVNQTKLYFVCKEIEDNYRKLVSSDSTGIRPRFYYLYSINSNSRQDVPKLDGFATSFILGTPESVKYSDLYESLMNIMNLLSQYDSFSRTNESKLSFLGYCALQYCCLINWRLMLCLPPSVSRLEKLSAAKMESLYFSDIIHTLIWVPRISHKKFTGWIQEYIMEQGLTMLQADVLLKNITEKLNNLGYDLKLTKHVLSSILKLWYVNELRSDTVLPLSSIPRFLDICLIDLMLAKIQVSHDKLLNEEKVEMDEAKNVAQLLLPLIFRLIELITVCARSVLLHHMLEEDKSINSLAVNSYSLVLQLGSSRTNKMAINAKFHVPPVVDYLPNGLRTVLDKWNDCTMSEFLSYNSWRATYEGDAIPSESYLSSLLTAHLSALSCKANFMIGASLKHALYTLVHFSSEMIVWATDDKNPQELVRVMFPLVPDAMMENLTDFIALALERIIGSVLSGEFRTRLYKLLFGVTYDLIVNHSIKDSGLDERILHEFLNCWENCLDQTSGKKAVEEFFVNDKDLVKILLSAANDNLTSAYGRNVLKFFNKLLQLIEKNPEDKSLARLSSSLSRLSRVDEDVLKHWLNKIVMTTLDSSKAGDSSMQENRLLLQSLTSYIVKDTTHIPEEVANVILRSLIEMASQILSPVSDSIGFSELMVVMANLANAGTGSGHLPLFKACIDWMSTCKKYLSQKDVLEKLEENVTDGRHQVVMESACYLMSYITDIVVALKYSSDKFAQLNRTGAPSPPCDGDFNPVEIDSDWTEDLGQDDDDSAVEDSDDDSLCNKLCTFTVTQKEFMNQHWYHCHTCKMVDGVGVCTVCAKVCHKDHDITYAKYGSFFCDCGAKEDASCQALVKRNATTARGEATIVTSTGNLPTTGSSPSTFSMDTMLLPSSLRRRATSPARCEKYGSDSKKSDEVSKNRQKLIKQLEVQREDFLAVLNSSDIVDIVLEMIQSLVGVVTENCKKKSNIGSIARARKALEELHTSSKTFETTEQLMVPTLGSQEGAFENVRMNYSGDQGQTIKQLISAHMVRRVAMCCLSSPHGRRQHLAVSHEKGKITVLQLSALLKQSDSSKRKLTLTRLASAPIPFTVLSVAGNPCNEDFLAVCGLKDCHVLTFSSTGSVCDHLVLHPQLESLNYIIKVVWLPGSQTELALVTADFVKVYNLSRDALSPQYYFLLPSSKIRDCCFVFPDDGQRHLLLISASGYIYHQLMSSESSAQHGPFYITTSIEIQHPDIKDTGSGQIANGGVSVYYSHTLQLLFFSYGQGKNFVAPLKKITGNERLKNLFAITYKSSVSNNNSSNNSNSNSSNNSTSNSNGGGNKWTGLQPLCQWGEIPGHPGLVTALTQSSNNPVVLMIKPKQILVQEIKVLPAKAKITDMVTIRHPSTVNNDHRTTLILLCEDGSLRIYMASIDQTGFWFNPSFQSANGCSLNYGLPFGSKSSKKKKTGSTQHPKIGRTPGSVSFAVDYFEHAQAMNDVEFGGNDLLQIYNASQLKHRLNTAGMYIASTKPTSFTMEVNNHDNSMVMVGVRILVGTQDIQRVPSYVEVMGRTQQMSAIMTRSRWFDFPFTHEESLTADKKLTIVFGTSADPANVSMVDSIKVYGKTKDAFGWPEESEEYLNGNVPSTNNASSSSAANVQTVESENAASLPMPISSLDRLVGRALEILDGCFAVIPSSDDKWAVKQNAIDLATQFLTFPSPASVSQHAKALLALLHSNRVAYNNHKDQTILRSVTQTLVSEDDDMAKIDAESFFCMMMLMRSVAVARPSNLVRYTDASLDNTLVSDQIEMEFAEDDSQQRQQQTPSQSNRNDADPHNFLLKLTDAFWRLHSAQPRNASIAPVCQPPLRHVEIMVQSLVDIIHAFTTYDLQNVHVASKLYVKLLLCEDPTVSFACKQALIRVLRPRPRRRRVFIPSPPHCSTPGVAEETERKSNLPRSSTETHEPVVINTSSGASGVLHPSSLPPSEASQESSSSETEQHYEVVGVEPMVLMPQDSAGENGQDAGAASSLEALFPPMLDIPPDADDETMVELAIALSLQDQPGQSGELNLQGLSSLAAQAQRASSLEGGHYSDSTASVGASDDEGSTAATDGSTLRTSPAEQGGSGANSESGGSAVDSMITEHNVSGRSSAYGDNVPESITTGARSETSSMGAPSSSLPQESDLLVTDIESCDVDTNKKLHSLRLMLLEKMLYHLPELRDVGGVRIIPFMQVLLILASDIDVTEDKDRTSLDNVVSVMISELNISATEQEIALLVERTPRHEVQLVIMRLLSVMMSRSKAGTVKPLSSSDSSSSFVSNTTANALLSSGSISFCLTVLKSLLQHWRNTTTDSSVANASAISSSSGGVSGGGIVTSNSNLLKPQPILSPAPDMSPFFLRQYVRGHANDVFEAYPQLLTEMVFRLPYQIKKIVNVSSESGREPMFDQAWYHYLCEYMMTQQTPFVRRQVRKLLLFICGTKEKYRQLRDLHALESHMKEIQVTCRQGGYGLFTNGGRQATICLSYNSLITLIEHLKACADIATSRTSNWQKFCLKDESVVQFLMQVSYLLDDGISPIILQLLQCAICGVKSLQQSSATVSTSTKMKNADKTSDNAKENDETVMYDEAQCMALVQQVNRVIDQKLLWNFIRCFLVESNQTSVRWQAHSLVLSIYRNSMTNQQKVLLNLMWNIWPLLSSYGRKAAQFVDLLGYLTLRMLPLLSYSSTKEFVKKAVDLLRKQNGVLANHPNANIYNSLLGLVEFDGFYLESDPCLVCNNPEVPFSNVKLSAIKVDSRFTTTTQVVKLVGSYTISKITLRIGELKRTKMVRTINVYYNNRSVQGVVELKNKPAMWHKAKSCNLGSGQTEAKIEFPLPIVACNLMVEYADFYENIQASTETLQCPRCSASVPANPGVCANCGENVFQCHKCRAINYDERDPFLCNACGFCKYAKFDYTLTAKSCSCSTDPIENEEDRKKTVASINNLLEKADRVYKQLIANKCPLEALLMYINDRTVIDSRMVDTDGSGINNITAAGVNTTTHPGIASVSRAIQQLAQRYCLDCKSLFEELSKIIQKVLASRKELVAYDRREKESRERSKLLASNNDATPSNNTPSSFDYTSPSVVTSRCYGCSSAATEYCITLLRALATSSRYRQMLCNEGPLLRQLVEHNLRRGSLVARYEVRQLLCLLTRDNIKATNELNTLIMEKISTSLKSQLTSPDLASSIRHELGLLSTSVQKEDSCWEQKLRCVMKLFLLGISINTPVILESLTLPCLNILQTLIKPVAPTTKKYKDKPVEAVTSVKLPGMEVRVDVNKWINGDQNHTYKAWKQRMSPKHVGDANVSSQNVSKMTKKEVHAMYLSEKYGRRWQERIRAKKQNKGSHALCEPKLAGFSWLRSVMFCPSSRSGRQAACTVIESLCQIEGRKKKLLDMLSCYLADVGKSGESAAEFLTLYQNLMKDTNWKYYLAIKGVLPYIGYLITAEIEQLTKLEENTLNSDLSQGYALKMLTELLSSFLAEDAIKHHFKSRLVGTVLNGYLSLRKLVVQRTKLIDETQDKLLELLEGMTTGTESETRAFMSVCVETVKKYPEDDMRTPLFVFERLCSIIYPEENDIGEFFMTLEKDPQQEDFLQGRMLGNPYSSGEPGLGPLMRDVKNKICQDCELVALLEDDSGMELLVNNKIISLDLPVKEVYKKIWCADNNDGDAMRVVYRMRGLLGDATEEFIESLNPKSREEIDNEEVYKMANVMSYCGGLEVMLQRLSTIDNLTRGRPLLVVLLKLFGHCIKVKANRQKLTDPSMMTIEVMLGTLKLALNSDPETVVGSASNATTTGCNTVIEQLLHIMETMLVEACLHSSVDYSEFSKTCGDESDIKSLFASLTSRSYVVSNSSVMQLLMRVVPFLTYGSCSKMQTVIDHFKPFLNFNKHDFEHSAIDTLQLECFCDLAAGIEAGKYGDQLKDLIVKNGIVEEALQYITMHTPPIKTVLFTDTDEWKEFVGKPALKYVLKILTGLSHKHENIQNLISTDCVPIMHRLEQMSSNERVGSLAENLMEAMKQNKAIAHKIEATRKQTKSEKKRLAMAMREKQLGALGMKTNEKGQVKAKSSILTQMGELMEETGLVCVICREGYKFQPSKVLGMYTFTKRVNMDDYENKTRKTPGYVTVSHFNIVHVDCHMAAVRLARGRDEWESAALQNANTRCNGLLPLWGPQVPESAFASCLARHNTYLQECTGHRDISYSSTIHDLKLLLQRFCQEKSFSDESGGGGPQSNMHLIPYVVHMSLYVINTTRSVSREEKNISNFLQSPPEKWIENSFDVESPFYWMTMYLIILPVASWNTNRLSLLKRIISTVHIRHVLSPKANTLADKTVKDYNVYKPGLLFFALVNGLYKHLFKKVVVPSGGSWPSYLAEYIRLNDQPLTESADRLLRIYQEDMLTCHSFAEFCDVIGLMEDIPDPDRFLSETISAIP